MPTPQLLIDGEFVDGADGAYDVINPATEEVVAGAPEASVAQALDAARAARDAFPAWSRTTPEHRAELVHDKLAYHKAIYERHGEGRTNLAYGYVNRNEG